MQTYGVWDDGNVQSWGTFHGQLYVRELSNFRHEYFVSFSAPGCVEACRHIGKQKSSDCDAVAMCHELRGIFPCVVERRATGIRTIAASATVESVERGRAKG